MPDNGKVDFKPWPVLDEAYVAGIIDADGHMAINKGKSGNTVRYCATVIVSNTYRPLLEEIKARWGGSIYVGASGYRVDRLTIMGAEAVALLEAVRPYLRVKACEAWLILEFTANREAKTGMPLSDEERALREGYYLAGKYACHNREALANAQ